ncbi:MAG: ADP-ribosylglycohydrolase family protein [Candidatus Rokubacteria bacterium]|nr:ADP-ribosylglycohydrolase family protein [Candidatus Rokubacteria bacterium]
MDRLAALPSRDAILGCLLGSAVGDSVGLACEGLSKRRQRRLFPETTLLVLGHGLRRLLPPY